MASNRKDSNGRVLPENVIQRKDGTYMWKKSIRGVQYCEYARTLGEIKQKRNKALGEIEAGTYEGKLEKIRKAKVIVFCQALFPEKSVKIVTVQLIR